MKKEICFNCRQEIKGNQLLRIKELNYQYGIKKDSIEWKFSFICYDCEREQEQHQNYINSFDD
jgi:hypothetical protein